MEVYLPHILPFILFALILTFRDVLPGLLPSTIYPTEMGAPDSVSELSVNRIFPTSDTPDGLSPLLGEPEVNVEAAPTNFRTPRTPFSDFLRDEVELLAGTFGHLFLSSYATRPKLKATPCAGESRRMGVRGVRNRRPNRCPFARNKKIL